MGCPEPSLISRPAGTSPCKSARADIQPPLPSTGQSCSSWKSQLWNYSLSGLLPLGICKVNICSSNFSPSFPACPFFLLKWKRAFTWREDRPLNIWNSSVLDFSLESYRTSLDVSYTAAPMFITHKSFTCLGFHVPWAEAGVFFLLFN